jgi:hypothetical protein
MPVKTRYFFVVVIVSVIHDIVVDVIFVDQHKYYFCIFENVPISVSAGSNAWVCDHLLAGIAVSNPAEGMDVCLF